MNARAVNATLLLLLTAFIWGTAFVAQRAGMASTGPFTYNGVRFLLGACVVLPIAVVRDRRGGAVTPGRGRAAAWIALAGGVLFCGSMLQQAGLVTSTAGKAGFITGLYIVFVPLIGAATGQRPGIGEAAGAVVSTTGLYLLSVTGDFSVDRGDLLVLGGAAAWAAHVLIIGRISPGIDTFVLAAGQFLVNAALSLGCALAFEAPDQASVRAAAVPIVYGGVASVGVAYTIQVAAQKHAPATLAVIVMSLESVFAAAAGWAVLGESMTRRMLAGAALMLAGMLIAQLLPAKGR